jgi:hypothetical protein
MIISGTGFILLAVTLLLVMREDDFVPTPKGDRETFAHLTSTLVHGLEVARRRPVVRNFFLITIIVGLSSEAFDRLWTVRILNDFRLPTLFGTSDPAVWFTVFALVGTLLSLATSVVVNKVSADRVNALHPNGLLALLSLIQVGGIVGLAVVGNLWLALAAMWARNAALAVAQSRALGSTATSTPRRARPSCRSTPRPTRSARSPAVPRSAPWPTEPPSVRRSLRQRSSCPRRRCCTSACDQLARTPMLTPARALPAGRGTSVSISRSRPRPGGGRSRT